MAGRVQKVRRRVSICWSVAEVPSRIWATSPGIRCTRQKDQDGDPEQHGHDRDQSPGDVLRHRAANRATRANATNVARADL